MIEKFITIDLEGDANVQQCREYWPEGNHFDKNTIPWCISFYDGIGIETYVCKLPQDERDIYDDNGKWLGRTKSCHLFSTKVPNCAHECKDLTEWCNRIYRLLKKCKEYNIPVYFKQYYDRDGIVHDYDKEVLEITFNKYNVDTSVLSIIKGLKIKTKPTFGQNKDSGLPNQEYMNMGVQHNREDVVELYRAIKENK